MLALLAVWLILMDYAIAPGVMGHELEIHPLLAIFTLMVGGAVGGIVGIYLSVPLVAALRVIYRRFAPPPVGVIAPGSFVGGSPNQEPRPRWWPEGRVETDMVMQRTAPAGADASQNLVATEGLVLFKG
jgi:hypothetical protein